jgi:hypothetical protein
MRQFRECRNEREARAEINPPKVFGSREPGWLEGQKKAGIAPDAIVVAACLVATIAFIVLAALGMLPGP